MFRRKFLGNLTVGAGLTALTASAYDETPEPDSTVKWNIKGFTCVACAVGLEVMLRRQKGVARARANYEESRVEIAFRPSVISETALRGFIQNTGFTVAGDA